MFVPIPPDVRELLEAPNYVHLSTLRADPISFKYTGEPFPSRGPDRVCFVIGVEKAAQRTLRFTHNPA